MVDVRFFAVVWKEEDMFVVREVFTGVTTQGGSIEEAVNNLREALELYLEEFRGLREFYVCFDWWFWLCYLCFVDIGKGVWFWVYNFGMLTLGE